MAGQSFTLDFWHAGCKVKDLVEAKLFDYFSPLASDAYMWERERVTCKEIGITCLRKPENTHRVFWPPRKNLSCQNGIKF